MQQNSTRLLTMRTRLSRFLFKIIVFFYKIAYNKSRKVRKSEKEAINMLAELRQKSQITIPKELVSKLGLKEGDKFDIFEQDGMIYLVPVTIYPKQYILELKNEIDELKNKIADGEQQLFDDIDELFNKMEE